MPRIEKKQAQIAIEKRMCAGDEDSKRPLERIFYAYRDYARKKSEETSIVHFDEVNNTHKDRYDSTERLLIEMATNIRAVNAPDLLYKLALWRWTSPHIADSLDAMPTREAVLYALFRDLVFITGKTDVATPLDLRTSFLSKKNND